MPQRLECNTAVLLKRMVYFCHVLPLLCFLSFVVIWNVQNTAQGKSFLVTDDMKEEKNDQYWEMYLLSISCFERHFEYVLVLCQPSLSQEQEKISFFWFNLTFILHEFSLGNLSAEENNSRPTGKEKRGLFI